jgi:hypothetical protein
MPSKLGPHVIAGRPELEEFIQRGTRLVKLVSNHPGDWLQHNPDVLIIGRWYDPLTAGEQWRAGIDPKKAASDYVRTQERHYKEMPEILYWEGHNEPSFGAPQDAEARDGMRWYAGFEVERVKILADMGLRAVIGNFSTGYPEVENDNRLWEEFLPALEAAHEHKGYLGLHEYSGPFMWSGWGPWSEQESCGYGKSDEGWLTLRYRKVHREILQPRALGTLPIVITECGLDSVGVWCPPKYSGPWQLLQERWLEWDGSTDPIDYWRGEERDPQRYYAEQLIWYDQELQKDPYLVGATIFTLGNFGSPWDKYEISGTRAVEHLLDHIGADPWTPESDSRDGNIIIKIPEASVPTNKLVNGNFESGKYYPLVDRRWPVGHELRGPIPNMNIPTGWEFWYALNGDEPKRPFYHEDGEDKLTPQDQPWGRPEVVTWKNANFSPEFQHAFAWRDGDYTLKVFGAFVPVWWRLHQNVSGLTPGHRYTLRVPVFMELISSYNPTVVAADPNSGELRLTTDSHTTGWQQHPFMKWNVIEVPLEATEGSHRVDIEFRGRWGLVNNACYVDGVTLVDAAKPVDDSDRNNTYQIGLLLDKVDESLERIRNLI